MTFNLDNNTIRLNNGIIYSENRTVPNTSLVNRINVGANGKYTTLKAAVDWFNASATGNTEILLDGGAHAIADTVTVNNGSYKLTIRGLGMDSSVLQAATGLTTTTSSEVQKGFYKCKLTYAHGKMTYQPSDTSDCVMLISGNAQVNQNNRNITIGIRKNGTGLVISPMTVRCATANQAYPFSLIAYLDDTIKDDYFEIFATSGNNGDVVKLQDLNWFFDARS